MFGWLWWPVFVILCNVLQAKICTSFYIVLLNCVLFDFVSLASDWGVGGVLLHFDFLFTLLSGTVLYFVCSVSLQLGFLPYVELWSPLLRKFSCYRVKLFDDFCLFGRTLGKGFDDSLPACAFFSFFLKVEISSCTPISLFRPGSVHSSSVS